MMQQLFELSVNVLENAIILDFMNRYFGFKQPKPRRYLICGIAFALLFLQISVLNVYLPLDNLGTYIAVVILFLYARANLAGIVTVQVFISILLMTIITLIAYGTNLLISSLSGLEPRILILQFSSVRIAAVLLTKMILFYVTRILLHFNEQNLRTNDLIPLTVIPLFSLLCVTLMMKAAFHDPDMQQIFLYATLCIFITNLLTYNLFIRVSKDHKNLMELALLRQKQEYTKKELEEAGILYREMSAVRHDSKNHIMILSGLLKNGEIDSAQQMLGQLLNTHDIYEPNMPDTGNDVLNAALGIKLSICREQNITVLLNVQNALSWVEPVDLSSLIGNLMDNAIEASTKSANPSVEAVIVPQEQYVSIVISNSIAQSVLGQNPHLRTTKRHTNEHGFGVRNIRKIVGKYNGLIDFYEYQQRFVCDILLPVPDEMLQKKSAHTYVVCEKRCTTV